MALARKLLSLITSSPFHLFFPPLCLHCDEKIESHKNPLCPACLKELILLDPLGKCLHCFTHLEDNKPLCDNCFQNPAPYKRAASVFDYQGPASSLIKALKYQSRTDYAKDVAAFMVMQLENLKWPLPDIIIPVPQTTLRKIERGFNQSALIANHLAQMLNIETLEVLKRKSGGFSQSSLSKAQREELSKDLFYCREQTDLSGKIALLIDDVLTTSTTLRCCAAALKEVFPKSIYVLTFCHAEKY